MKIRFVHCAHAAATFFALVAGTAYASQAATNYSIPMDVIDSGGADVSKSSNYLLSDSVGEPAVGFGASTNYILNSGYRQPSASEFLSMTCSPNANIGSVAATGQKTGSGTCTVYTDAYDGYRMVWRAGSNNGGGLVGHWKLDETSSTNAYDSSGFGNAGTHVNSPTATTDVPSRYFSTRSVSFNGSSQYIHLGTGTIGTNAIGGASAVTISAWVRYTTLDSGQYDNVIYVSRVGSATNANVWMNIRGDFANAGKLLVGGRSQSGDSFQEKTSTTVLVANTWYHVTGILDYTHDTINIAINGVLLGETAVTFGSDLYTHSGTPTQPDSISSANYVSTYPFPGNIDDVRLYRQALTGDEIRDLASLAPPGSLTASGSQIEYIPGIFFPSTGGLIGHWKLEDTIGGSTVADSSGYNNDGTPTGAGGANNTPQPSTNVPGSTTFLTTRSLDFDGTDDYVQFAASGVGPLNGIGTGDFSVAIWATNTATSGYREMIANWASTGLLFGRDTTAGKLHAYVGGGAGNVASINYTIPTDGSWHHYVLTRTSGTVQAYVDGAAQGSSFTAAGTLAAAAASRLGSRGDSLDEFWLGKLDDPRIYNRALSLAEIKALYSEPQTWSVAVTESAWGARLSSDSTDDDPKWGTDGGSEKWLNLGDGTYTVVRRPTATPLSGSVEQMEFRGEVGSSKVQTSGIYLGVVTFTVVGY